MTTSTLTGVVRRPAAALTPVLAPAARRAAAACAYPVLLVGLLLVVLAYGAAALTALWLAFDLLG